MDIYFNEKKHTYTDKNSKPFKYSVTQKISLFTNKFDTEYWSEAKAIEEVFTNKNGWDKWNILKRNYKYKDLIECLKESIPIDILEEINNRKKAIKIKWKKETINACNKGNKIHSILETSINYATGYNPIKNKEITKLFTVLDIIRNPDNNNIDLNKLKKTKIYTDYLSIYNYIKNKVKQGYNCYAEVAVFNITYSICGLIDLMLYSPITGKFIIVDWKTNKEMIKFEAGYYKKENNIKTNIWIKTNETMNYPLEHLPNCKGFNHTLQLSMYAFLAEEFGISCDELILYHIRENTVSYDILYLKKEIEQILNLN